MKRGQLSLETIIQFVIIAVVVATIISLIFNTLPSDNPEIAGETRSRGEIRSTCESHCTDWIYASERDKPAEALDYCIARFTLDSNDNGQVNIVHSCSDQGQTLDADGCIEMMCQRYMEQGMTAEAASGNISKMFELGEANANRGAGTCDLNEAEGPGGAELSTWWKDYFSPPGNTPTDLCDGVAP